MLPYSKRCQNQILILNFRNSHDDAELLTEQPVLLKENSNDKDHKRYVGEKGEKQRPP
jgi:hypothetical protein